MVKLYNNVYFLILSQYDGIKSGMRGRCMMDRYKVFGVLVIVVFVLVISGAVYAGCGVCPSSSSKGETVSTCPVTGTELGKDTSKQDQKCMIKCPKCGTDIDVLEQCKKQLPKGSCPIK